MKTTVVPAQVTTVEDKIAGNLGVSQLLLLVAPVFVGGILFVMLPPFFSYAVYKIVLIACMSTICSVLAIRIRGKILMVWATVLLRYNLRPRYYVFNKNSGHLRDVSSNAIPDEDPEQVAPTVHIRPISPRLSTAEMVQVENIIANPQANLHFRTNRKGELSVHITEVQ